MKVQPAGLADELKIVRGVHMREGERKNQREGERERSRMT